MESSPVHMHGIESALNIQIQDHSQAESETDGSSTADVRVPEHSSQVGTSTQERLQDENVRVNAEGDAEGDVEGDAEGGVSTTRVSRATIADVSNSLRNSRTRISLASRAAAHKGAAVLTEAAAPAATRSIRLQSIT